MATRTTAAFALLSLLLAGNAAARMEFMLMRGDTRVEGGEICFLRLPSEKRSEDPEITFFATNDVRCLPADKIVQFPVGRFHFFGRHEATGFGATRGVLAWGPSSSVKSYRAVSVPLGPAATLDFADVPARIPGGGFAGVWIADRKTAVGTFIPLAPNESTMLVPAGIPIFPMLVSGRRPYAVGDALTLTPGETRRVPEIRAIPGRNDVVVWIQSDLELIARTLPNASVKLPFAEMLESVESTPPAVTLVDSKGVEHQPEAPLAAGDIVGALLLFKAVPAGTARVSLHGRAWESDELPIEVGADTPAQYIAQPLMTAPAGVLTVRWWLTTGAVDAAQVSARSCKDEAKEEVSVTVHRCASAADDAPIGSDCTLFARTSAPPSADGFVEIGSLPTGSYRVELTYPHLGTFRRSVPVSAQHKSTAAIGIEPFPVHGRITRDGKPVRAEVRFATGRAVTSEEDGEFRVLLARSPEANLVDIQSCEGGIRYTHIPAEALQPNERLEIAIPLNAIDVTVTDAPTGAPLAGADVRAAVVKSIADESAYYSRLAASDEKGKARVESVPPERQVVVCVSKEGYDKRCLEQPFELKPDEKKALSIALSSAGTRAGRLIGVEPPIALGRLFWIAPSGAVIEDTTVQPDGSFHYRVPHGTGEHVLFVSKNHSLSLFPQPPVATDAAFEIAVPPAPSRTFQVRLPADSDRRGARLGLAIGGVTVPERGFSWHQAHRRAQADIIDGRAVTVADIAETAPIVVRFGPEPDDLKYAQFRDIFASLGSAFPQVAVTGSVVELRP